MDLFEAVRRRASVRSLQPTDVPGSDLELILDAGRRAASGRNRQPRDFIVVRDRDTLRQLAAAQACIGDVSLAIVIVGKPDESEYWLEDVSAAAENMLLAITALGHASVWIEGTLLRREDDWKRLLGVPDDLRVVVILPIGAPAGEVAQAPKRPLAEMVHYERYTRRG